MKDGKEKLEMLKLTFQEAKDQYKIVLEGFSDIKTKTQILLVVCSLFITLPLSNGFIVNSILASYVVTTLFVLGILSLVVAIILLVFGLKATQVAMPMVEDMYNSIGHYENIGILNAVIKNYIKNIKGVRDATDSRRKFVNKAERLIILGVTLIFGIVIFILMRGAIYG